jgi:hypothetical protein
VLDILCIADSVTSLRWNSLLSLVVIVVVAAFFFYIIDVIVSLSRRFVPSWFVVA